jgi:hypothetical protein
MSIPTVQDDLAQVANERAMLDAVDDLTDGWKAAGFGVDTVEPVLRIMEAHPDWDFGAPGALVHYVERFYRRGYEAMLIASLKRRPTSHTLWMLNRVINGEKDVQNKRKFVALLASIAGDPDQEAAVQEVAANFLSLHGR